MTFRAHSPTSDRPVRSPGEIGRDAVHDTGPFTELRLSVRPGEVFRALCVLTALVVLVGTLANIVIYHVAPSPDHPLARLMRRLDLGHEPSVPQWYSSLLHLSNAVLASLIAVMSRRTTTRDVWRWSAFAVLLLYLAVDEAVMIHELADSTLHRVLDTGGLLYFAWVIPGTAFVLAVGLGFSRFLLELDRRTRWLLVMSGLVFVSGAIGMELVAGVIMDAHGSVEAGVYSLAHTASQAVEETLEMLGASILVYALLDYMARNIRSVRLSVIGRTVPKPITPPA